MQDNNTIVAQNLGGIRYSRGKNCYDNEPEQEAVDSFSEFIKAVDEDRSPRKGMAYITAPMSHGPHNHPEKHPDDGHYRLGSHAGPRRYLPLDFDGFESPEVFGNVRDYLGQFSAYIYTTASHTEDAPRARALIELSREVGRTEGIDLGIAFQAQLEAAIGTGKIKFDQSVYRAEQPCYTPGTTSQTWAYTGKPLDVDGCLKGYKPPFNPFASKGGNLSDLDMGVEETPANIAHVGNALAYIPSSVSAGCDRDMYLRVIWGVAATGFSCAETMARDWCQGSPDDFDEAAFERDFNSYDRRAGGIGVGTLFHIAEQFGFAAVTHDVQAAMPGAVTVTDDGWPEPAPIDQPTPDVKSFSVGLLPKSFAAYVEDQAELMQSPPDYVAVPLMVGAAAALGNRMAIAPKELDTSWLVVPVLWGGIVGRPSTMKSPSMSRALAPLSQIETDLATAFETKRQQYATDKVRYEAEYDKAKKEIKNGTVGVMLPPEPEEPQPERLVVNDSTYQKLTEILRNSPRGVLVVRDELVSLLTGLASEGQEGARGFYLEAWNGTGSYRVDRVGRGSYILKNPAVSIVGGIQPGKLQPYIKDAVFGGNSDDGLLQRFQMLVWPDVTKQWNNVDRRPDFDAQMAVDAVFRRLHNIDPVAIGATIDQLGERPAYLHFTTEAQSLFDQFRMKLEVSLRNDAKHPALESHLAKYRSLVPALALVIHLADDGTGPVTKSALEKAIGWSKYLWSHARRVYACVTHSAGFAARALADRIQSGKLESGFTVRAVARNSWQHLTDVDDVRAAIEWLTDAGWLRAHDKPTTEKGGRSTVTYLINPKVMKR